MDKNELWMMDQHEPNEPQLAVDQNREDTAASSELPTEAFFLRGSNVSWRWRFQLYWETRGILRFRLDKWCNPRYDLQCKLKSTFSRGERVWGLRIWVDLGSFLGQGIGLEVVSCVS